MNRYLPLALACAFSAQAAHANSMLPDSVKAVASGNTCTTAPNTDGTENFDLTFPDGRKVPVTAVGVGLRLKKVVFVNDDAYCATFYVDKSSVAAYKAAIAKGDATGAAEDGVFTDMMTLGAALEAKTQTLAAGATPPAAAIRLDIDFFINTPGSAAASDFTTALKLNMVGNNGGAYASSQLSPAAGVSTPYSTFLADVTNGGSDNNGTNLIIAFDFVNNQIYYEGANGIEDTTPIADTSTNAAAAVAAGVDPFLTNILNIWFGDVSYDQGLQNLKTGFLKGL